MKEEIRKKLLKENTPTNRSAIASFVGSNPVRCQALIDIFLGDDNRLIQRAAVVVNIVSKTNPELLLPYNQLFINQLGTPNLQDSIKRNLMRYWAETKIPALYYGEIYELADAYLSGKEAIAIKAHAMMVAYKIAQEIPELRNELTIKIEEQLSKFGAESPGIRSRSIRLLKMLKKSALKP